MQYTTFVSFMAALFAVSPSALAVAIPSPNVKRQAAVCNLHVKQHTEPTKLEYAVTDSNGNITDQDTLEVENEQNTFAPPSCIAPDNAPIYMNAARPENALGFSYKGCEFSTFDGCSVGAFDGRARVMDCSFPC